MFTPQCRRLLHLSAHLTPSKVPPSQQLTALLVGSPYLPARPCQTDQQISHSLPTQIVLRFLLDTDSPCLLTDGKQESCQSGRGHEPSAAPPFAGAQCAAGEKSSAFLFRTRFISPNRPLPFSLSNQNTHQMCFTEHSFSTRSNNF